jgi:hypothetical protein
MQRFEAGYAAGNAEAIVACFAQDVVWTLPDSRVLHGREACLAFLKERFASPHWPQVLGLAHECAGPNRGAKLQGGRAHCPVANRSRWTAPMCTKSAMA